MDRIDMKIQACVICVDEGLIYVMSSCRSGCFDAWTLVRNFGIMQHQFGFRAKSLTEACDVVYSNYLNGNLLFDSEDDISLWERMCFDKALENQELLSD